MLDTNVVLDLRIFGDVHCHALAAELAARPGCWHATPRMRHEFDDVLARPAFERWAPRCTQAAARWGDWATMSEPLAVTTVPMRCPDPDDQMFLDLAVQLGPCCLLSRDAELLRLRRPAARVGVRIATPAEFRRA